MSILDHFKTFDEFTPETIGEYMALQVARHMQDLKNLHWHIRLFQNHSAEEIVGAFHRIRSSSSDPSVLKDRFRSFFQS